MNFFAHASAAERYAAARPYFHPLVIERIRTRLKLEHPVPQALDVACGTGQSSLALQAIAEHVTGTDISNEMLEHARKITGIVFVQAPAEQLPFANQTFDLITVCMAFHWFDQPAFLREAKRVLQKYGWLVVYNNWFTGEMLEQSAFTSWIERFYAHYQIPPRQNTPLTAEFFAEHGFGLESIEEFRNTVEFTPDQLAAYLTTQSNVIAKVEQGVERLEDIHHRIVRDMQGIFTQPRALFQFAGRIWYLQPQQGRA